MTREKEIEKASAHRYDEWGEQAHAFELAFQAGAMWADNHPHKCDDDGKDYLKELLGYDPVEEFEQMVAKVYKEGGIL